MGASPAFSFYAKDFLTGTATMSLAEVGAYVKFLAYQWDSGAVPSAAKERARILGCTAVEERRVWERLVSKFDYVEDSFKNARLEDERNKQADRKQRLSDNGKLGGRPPKAKPKLDEKPGFPSAKADGNLHERLSSSSSSSEEEKPTHTARVNGYGNGANPPGSLPRDHRFHPVCGARRRVCLSETTAATFVADWGGEQTDALAALQRFCNELEAEIGDGPKGNHIWLLEHFDAFKARNGRVPLSAPKVKPVKDDSAQLARLQAIERGEVRR